VELASRRNWLPRRGRLQRDRWRERNPATADDLAVMLAERKAGNAGQLDRSSYLFLRPTVLPLNLDKFRQDVIRPALRDAGLPETLRTYDIRHSHASLLID
jgi:hypothetical protein